MSTRHSDRATAAADTGRKRWQRVGAVVAAVGAAVATWAVVEGLLDVDLRAPMFNDAGGQDIGVAAVILASTTASLAAWALLALLERWTVRARVIWAAVSALVFVGSLAAPMSGTGISQSDRWLLALLHLVVAVTLIPLLYRTAKPPTGSRSNV